ncbi:hypothetical protein [Kordiimonas lacus]|uniref:Uncharacterized protein n=1 Tax=Kordiimonas lacus TaxID=637679 RepID=A0A1G7E2M6_9PROT|nr:hypothetical protein [Kordiimonas lacus]SDE57954.1 hypothetical protein SAMN04488071_3257 [Kordiimonas lacus]
MGEAATTGTQVFRGYRKREIRIIVITALWTLFLFSVAIHPYVFDIDYEYPIFAGFFTLTLTLGVGPLFVVVQDYFIADPVVEITPDALRLEGHSIPWVNIDAVRRNPEGIRIDYLQVDWDTFRFKEPENADIYQLPVLLPYGAVKANPDVLFDAIYDAWDATAELRQMLKKNPELLFPDEQAEERPQEPKPRFRRRRRRPS